MLPQKPHRPKTPIPKLNFFSKFYAIRLHEFLEALNSSLAYSGGELGKNYPSIGWSRIFFGAFCDG